MKAVIARELNDIAVMDVELEPPRAGEVLVQMRATGVCHSDLSIINGTIGHRLPAVVGHEGAGIVEQVGDGVTQVGPGDHVVMSFVPNCGDCFYCQRGEPFCCERNVVDGGLLDGTSRVRLNGEEIAVTLFQGNMAEYAVVPECCVVAVDPSYDFRVAALVSCGVTTGVGAALRTARVQPGSTVAVFGCGGVGLNVVQGARIAGATRIVAIDLSTEKLELALAFGATDTVAPGTNPVKAIRELTGGYGVDYAFEAVGNGKLVETCVKSTRMNGTTVLVGIGGIDDTFTLNTLAVPMTGKTIRGCLFGSANFRVDVPMYLSMYRRGMLDIDRLISRTYSIDEAPRAFADLERGVNARGVIVY
ncbi:MAG: Zn-dependent alcohol dehydrogenase [Pseudomonadota bacterium]